MCFVVANLCFSHFLVARIEEYRHRKELLAERRAALLKFVTACERGPSLGFGALEPPFTIRKIPDADKLPSASTCFNTLKLPSYSSEKVLRERLLTSIHSGAGFDLS